MITRSPAGTTCSPFSANSGPDARRTRPTAPLLPQGVLAPFGKLVCYGSNQPTDIPISFTAMLWGSLTLQMYLVYELRDEERAAAIAALNAMLLGNGLVHTIGARFPLDRIAEAHEAVEGGGVIGNVVLEI